MIMTDKERIEELEKSNADLLERLARTIAEKNKEIEKRQKITEKVDAVLGGAENQMKAFEHLKGSWLSLFFIPQDLGFKEIEKREPGLPTIRIYVKDDVAITKLSNNRWNIVKGDQEMQFDIHNKCIGYHILKAIGVKFD